DDKKAQLPSDAYAASPTVKTASPSVNLSAEQSGQTSGSFVEQRPPVGTDHVHGPAELRYCLAEDIRLDGAKGAINRRVDSEVERYNSMVSDYNSRCSEFRYQKELFEKAKREVETHRSEFEIEGRARFARIPDVPSPADGKEDPLRVISDGTR